MFGTSRCGGTLRIMYRTCVKFASPWRGFQGISRCCQCYNDVTSGNGGLQLRRETVEIAGTPVYLACPDVNAVLDNFMHDEKGYESGDPYWADVWPSARAVAEVLLSKPDIVKDMRVADVGCGLGLAGIAAGIAGAKEVTFLDRKKTALQCAILGAAASGLQVMQHTTELCDFSEDEKEISLFREHDIPQQKKPCVAHAAPFDWDAVDSSTDIAVFDVVIACDVLYEEMAVDPVAQLLPRLLSEQWSGQRRIILGDPLSRTPDHRKKFLKSIAEYDASLVVDFVRAVTVPGKDVSFGDIQVIGLRRTVEGDTLGRPISQYMDFFT